MNKHTMLFARFYINAIFNGASKELMKQRYSEWDFEATDTHFVLKKAVSEPLPTPAITPQGEIVAEKINMQVGHGDELAGAAAAAAAAAHNPEATTTPLIPVE